ncbi:MAG: magnesium/cobalt transporter CorA [Candidatus Omnitrophota bacterium]
MVRPIKMISKTLGLPPGTPVLVGNERIGKAKITVFDYDAANVEEKEAKTVEECFPFKDKPSVTWINVDGIGDVETIEKVNEHFGIHPLVLEDILNTTQRPKMEDFEDYIFIVLKMIHFEGKTDEVISEQVCLIVGPNYVISFQETEGDLFDLIRDRIRQNKGRIRKMGADYLAYSLIDAIVDGYFVILEKQGDEIENLEEELLKGAEPKMPQEIHQLKREMIFLRKHIWPLREVINGLQKSEVELIKKATSFYLRDVYDHTIQIIDTVESFRDMLSGMLDIYLSSISNRMNEVMKVLTIIATIFIPLTFIAGVYGMNFKYMPELEWRWGYFGALGLMALVGILMLNFFRRKKWL